MFLLIDKHRMVVVHRHENNVALSKLAHIEMSHCPASIFDEVHEENWLCFTHTELMHLYEGMVGLKYVGHAINPLVALLMRLALTIEPTKLDGFEATLQANSISFTDKNYYQYVFGSNKPKLMEDVFNGAARRGSLTQAVALPLATPAKPPQSPILPAHQWQPAAPVVPPKYPPPWA